jgi:fructose-bisphosphate aldolase class II
MKSLRYYLTRAKIEGWALGQFNFATLEVLQSIVETGAELKSPLILGTSEGEAKFFGIKEAVLLRDYYRKKYNLPIFLNLDHGKNLRYIKEAIKSGYDAIHFDGSDLSFEKNIEILKKIRKEAGRKIVLEGEINEIKGHSKFLKKMPTRSELTNPELAQKFSKETKIDSLAIAIGSFHGVSLKEPELDFGRLKEIRKRVKVFLVLHGGSGIRKNQLKKAVEQGISKVNINTELRLIWQEGIKKVLEKEPDEARPYRILEKLKIPIQKKVREKILIFGSKEKI